MSKIEVDAIEPQSGTTLTIGASGDTITIPAGATLTNSGTATGFGKVLQVVSATTLTADSTTSDTFQDSSLFASITPSSASNKIFVIVSSRAGMSIGDRSPRFAIFRGATNITGSTSTEGISVFQANGNTVQSLSITILDEPSTTSSTTYRLKFRTQDGTAQSCSTNGSTGKNSITLMEIAG
jgi:hypothetical protein